MGDVRGQTIAAYVRPDLADAVKKAAASDRMTKAAWITKAVQEKLERDKAPSLVPSIKEEV